MRKTLVRVLVAALAIPLIGLLARTAQAQVDYTVPISLTLSANFNTVQMHFDYQGDDNEDAVATVRYWKTSDGPTLADTGYPLIRDSAQRDFNGVIFWLAEGTDYTVEVTIDDAHDGIRGEAIWTSTITTRATPILPSNPTIKWVATNGNDVTGNGSSGTPYATIAKAHSVLPSGGQIRLKAGTYHEAPTLTLNGPSGSYYSLVGDGAAGGVILDGSVDLTTGWGKYMRGNTWIDNIWVRELPSTAEVPWLKTVFQETDTRLHSVVTRAELETNAPPPGQPSLGWPVGRFWHDTAGIVDSLFVRLSDGGEPGTTNHHVRAAQVGNGVKVWGTRWYLKNLDVRYDNEASILLGAYNYQFATESVVDSCRASRNCGGGAYGNLGSDGLLIQNCIFSDPSIDGWSYGSGKARVEEGARGLIWTGRACVIRNNTVTGTFDGIQTMGSLCNRLGSQDSDVHDNLVDQVCDDGLEFDATCAINLSAWRNTVRGANHGFSSNPVFIGPLYVLYNTIAKCDQAGVKSGASCSDQCSPCASPGWVGFFHNTFESLSYFSAMHDVGGYFGNQHWLNNILVGNVDASGFWPLVINVQNEGDPQTCTFDYDLIYLQGSLPGAPIWRWGFIPNTTTNYFYYTVGPTGDLYSGNAISPARGWEYHGAYGAPAFVDPPTDNLHLAAGSPAINMGGLISGINTPIHTPVGGPLYSGSAPDAGAFEYTGGAPQQAMQPAGNRTLFSIESPSPNPAREGVAFSIVTSAAVSVQARIYDVSGRLVKTLMNETIAPGRHTVRWDGARAGGRVNPGLYFLRVRSDLGSRDMRVVLVR